MEEEGVNFVISTYEENYGEIEKNKKLNLNNTLSVLMSPQGKLLNKQLTNELINFECINIISSRYGELIKDLLMSILI